jgi:hypothetical protein
MRGLLAVAVAGMFCFSGGALADKWQVGSWMVDIGTTYAEAYTANDSGSTFGFFCYGGSCGFYLDTGARCDENSKTPYLINAESGSTFVIGTCVHLRSGGTVRYVNSFQDKDIVTAISSGKLIGFAVPLANGDFKVVRFSLNGALGASSQAIDGMRAQPKVRDTGLRDRTM